MLQSQDASSSADPAERQAPPALRHAAPPRVVELATADSFRRLVEQQAQRCRRHGEPFSALCLQAEPDTHLEENQQLVLLTECARRLCRGVRVPDTVARWQRRQFGILLPGCEPPRAAAVLARLTQAASGAYSVGDATPRLRLHGLVLALPAS